MKNGLIMAALALMMAAGTVKMFSQGEDTGLYTGLKTDKGMLLVYNFRNEAMTLEIKASNMDKIPNENLMLNADGKLLQVLIVPVSAFISEKAPVNNQARDILLAHRAYESEYLNETFKRVIELKSEEITTPGKTMWLFWEFDTPKEYIDSSAVIVSKQMYATTLVNDKTVLMISTMVTEKDKEADIKNFLMEVMASYKYSAKPIDIEKLKEALRTKK